MSESRIRLSSGEVFESLSELVASKDFRGGDEITFLSDVTVDQPIVIDKKCLFDLGDHFLFVPIPQAITVKGGALVEFYNGKIQTLSPEQVEDALIVQGSKTTVTLGHDLEIDTRGTAVRVRKRGNLIIDEGSVRSTGSQPTIFVDDAYSTLTMYRGLVASYEKNAIVARNEGTVVIDGGEVHTESNGLIPETTYPAIIVFGQNTKLQVNGGSIFSVKTPAISIQSSGSMEMNGGTVYSNSKDFTAVEVQDAYSSFKLVDGWVYSTKTSAILSNKLGYNDVHTIQVTGGKVGAVGNIVNIGGPGDHGVLFSAGLVKGELPQDQIATGYVVSETPTADGYAPIILKTWSEPTDVSPIFPTAGSDPDVRDDNPFEPVPDPDVPEVLPFPPAPVAGTPDDKDSSETLLSTIENPVPLPQPPVESPFTPPVVPVAPVIPVPVPEDFDPTAGPMPQPGPKPGPIPGPEQDQVNDRIFNSSVNVKHTIYIYKTPSRKTKITEWRGALRVYDGGYFGPNNDEFAMVKFRVPGSGQTATGYALVYDLSHP